MGKAVVTALGVLAVGLAAAIVVWLRGAEATQTEPAVDSGFFRRLVEEVRVASAAVAGGMTAGLLVAGFGGRLLMRLIAATSSAEAQGRLTEADERVGVVTFDGSMFLILFVGLFGGAFGGIIYWLLRRWLPGRSLLAGIIVAGIAGGLLARPSDLLNPGSRDFLIVDPRWLAATMGVLLIAGFGLAGGVLIDTFILRWPAPAPTIGGSAGLLPLVPLFGPFLAVVAVVTMLRAALPPRGIKNRPTWPALAASWVVVAAGAVGWVWTLTNAVKIAI